MRSAAKMVQRHVKENAPVLTGELKRSIKVKAGRRSRNRQTVNVVAGVPYYRKVEAQWGFASIGVNDADRFIDDIFTDHIERELARI